jgi:hypothetical protein
VHALQRLAGPSFASVFCFLFFVRECAVGERSGEAIGREHPGGLLCRAAVGCGSTVCEGIGWIGDWVCHGMSLGYNGSYG